MSSARAPGDNSRDSAFDGAGNLSDDRGDCLFTYDYRNRIIEVKRKGDSTPAGSIV